MNEMVKIGLEFAAKAHEGQVRKESSVPYIKHPIEVMNTFNELVVPWIKENTIYDEFEINILRVACLGHDVIEDTPYKNWSDFQEAGIHLKAYYRIVGLTDTAKIDHPYANRAERKAIDAARMSAQDRDVQLIKMCDIRCNVTDYVNENPKYAATVYIPEKIAFVKFMTKLPDVFKKDLLDFLNAKLKEAKSKY